MLHPARVEDLEHDHLLHLPHLGPVLRVQGVDQQARTSSWPIVASSSAVAVTPSASCDQAARSSRAWESGPARACRGPCCRVGEIEPAIELVGERGPLVVVVGLLDQERLDLGPEHGPELFGVDDRVKPVRRPGRQALAIIAWRQVVLGRTLRQEPRQGDPDGELRLLDGVVLAGRWPGAGGRSRPDRAPSRSRDRSPARTCGGPAGQRSTSPVGLEEFAGRCQVDVLDGGRGLLVQEILQVVAAELEFLAVLAGELPEVLLLEVQIEPRVGPVLEGQPGPLGGLGVGGEVLLDGLADGLAKLAFGLRVDDVGGVLERGALQVARGQRRCSGAARPTRRNWPCRSRRPGTARRRPGSGESIISRILSLGGAPSSRLWRNE